MLRVGMPLNTPYLPQKSNRPDEEELRQAKAKRKQQYQARLAHVIAHENAHAAAGGRFAGAPVIEADETSGHVSGHVPIRMDFGKTSKDALSNARIIFGAATAVSDMSAADSAVAAAALSIGYSLAASRKIQEEAAERNAHSSVRFASQQGPFQAPKHNPFAH